MKYNVTKIMMDLGIQLKEEFNIYKSKSNEEYINESENIIDIFLNKKIEKCNDDIKEIQRKISRKLIERKNINNQLLDKISKYKEEIKNKFNENISLLEEFLKKMNDNERIDNGKENKNLTQIIQEIIDKYKEYNFLEIYLKCSNNTKNVINIDIVQIKNIIKNVKTLCQNKKEMLNGIIPFIVNLINSFQNFELNFDNQIKYHEYKNQIEDEKKSNKNNDINNIIIEYNNSKITIINMKNKLMELYDEFTLFKEKLENDENIYNNQLEAEFIHKEKTKCFFEHKNISYLHDTLEETNYDENDDDYNQMINEINKLKNDISNKKNFLSELFKNNNNKNGLDKYTDILNKSKDSLINLNSYLSKQNKELKELLSNRDNIDKSINDLKTEFLILNTLPNQYKINRIFLINDIIISKLKKLEEKFKLMFGENFEIKNIYNDSNPKIIWNKADIPLLAKDILLLKEEKSQLEKDINLLKASLESTLNEKGNNNHIAILLKIKEENKYLRKEIQRIKEKNVLLQEKLKEFNKNADIYYNELFSYEFHEQKVNEQSIPSNSYSGENNFNNHKICNKNEINNFINGYKMEIKENQDNSNTLKKKLLHLNYNIDNSCLLRTDTVSKKTKRRYSSVEN